jgi:hypothetical protein
MSLLNWIRRYQELGFVVHPCCPPDHRCQSPGKIPYDPYERQHMAGWQNHPQFTLEKWAEWIDLEPNLNVGFLTGSPSRLVAVDIDNQAGEELFRERTSEEERRTWQYTTGKGSRIIYGKDGGSQSVRISQGGASFELLGDGRQSVLPPSVHPSGRRYGWVDGMSPRACALQGTPASIQRGVSEVTSEKEDWQAIIQAPVVEGSRNETLTKLAGHLLAPAPVPPDEVYEWLRCYSRVHCQPPLDDGEIKMIVKSIYLRERRQEAQREQEIRTLMKNHGINRDAAETLWRGMCV